MLGMLSPASRGALMTAAIFLYVFMGLIAGYHSGRLYKTMKGKEWKRAAFLVSNFACTVLLIIKHFHETFFLNYYCYFLIIYTDCNPLSWLYGSNGLFPQLFHLGETQQWSCTLYYNAQAVMLVALHLFPLGFRRLLLWLSKSTF